MFCAKCKYFLRETEWGGAGAFVSTAVSCTEGLVKRFAAGAFVRRRAAVTVMMLVVMARKLKVPLRLVGCMMPFSDVCGGVWMSALGGSVR